ncbi:uncharacterized [Tachysurus ichikawai]
MSCPSPDLCLSMKQSDAGASAGKRFRISDPQVATGSAPFILGGGPTGWQLGTMPGIDVEKLGCDGEVLCEDCLED